MIKCENHIDMWAFTILIETRKLINIRKRECAAQNAGERYEKKNVTMD